MRAVSVIIAGAVLYAGFRAYQGMGGKNTIFDMLATDAALVGAKIMATPASSMDISQVGIDAIAKREGFAPRKYPDASGYSIGYGHFIKPGESFAEPMPEWKARELLTADVKIAADAVRAYVKVPLTQNQFDALSSFVYNVGVGAFKKSTLLAKLNAGDIAGAAAQFDRWHIPAIVIGRRNQEKAQFLA